MEFGDDAQRIHGSESKIELWYQILAFYEIAGMIYLGALAPLIFENSIHASLDQGGRQDISASARFITRVIPTPPLPNSDRSEVT